MFFPSSPGSRGWTLSMLIRRPISPQGPGRGWPARGRRVRVFAAWRRRGPSSRPAARRTPTETGRQLSSSAPSVSRWPPGGRPSRRPCRPRGKQLRRRLGPQARRRGGGGIRSWPSPRRTTGAPRRRAGRSRKFIGGVPTNPATNRLAGLLVDLQRRAALVDHAVLHDHDRGRPGSWPLPGRG